MTALKDLCEGFVERGYAGPFPVLNAHDRSRVLKLFKNCPILRPLDWIKGYAATSRTFYELGTHPTILNVVSALLGKNVLLWGASLQTRAPNEIHHWHTDIESSGSKGRTVAVWIGIQNSNSDSSLSIIPYSHNWNVTVQELRHQFAKKREDTTSEDVLKWARKFDERPSLLTPEVKDGEALFFDGSLWHYSRNLLSEVRHALLFQYATPDVAVRIPIPNHLDWPFRYFDKPKPPCLLVLGNDHSRVNRIVSPPRAEADSSSHPLAATFCSIETPLPPASDAATGWKPYPLFEGPTFSARNFSCHVSVLNHDRIPHPPHKHCEEEILYLLRGEVDIILPDLNGFAKKKRRLFPGDFVYYPAGFAHTLHTISKEPANYMMLKWRGDPFASESKVRFGQYSMRENDVDSLQQGFHCKELFSGPTTCLAKLQCHRSTVSPGAGYEPHVDPYDVVILVLDGEIETLNRRVGPNTVIFYPAGEPHGLRNPGRITARYVVFEFHPAAGPIPSNRLNGSPSFFTKLKDPKRWKRRLKNTAILRRYFQQV